VAASGWAKLKALVADKVPFLLPARWRAHAVLAAHPRTLIRDAREGQRIKLVGEIRAEAPLLKSPIAGEACIFYRTLVQEIIHDGDDQRAVTVGFDERRCDFVLVDASGEVLVQSDTAELNVPSIWETRYHPAIEPFVSRSTKLSDGPFWQKNLRYQESMLSVGATVAVMGAGRFEAYGDAGAGMPYRASGARLVLAGTPERPLLISGRLEDWIDYL
jgi:hypothetical protein